MKNLAEISKEPILPRNFMSVAVGLISEESILFAAESQTTRDKLKMLGTNKVSVLTFANGENAIVAQAGNADRSARVVEIMENMALSENIKDHDTLSEITRKSISQARNEMRAQMFNCSAEELQEYIWKHEQDCWIMTGHYFKGTPMLHTGNFAQGICSRVTTSKRSDFSPRLFATIGTGSDLAFYLLNQYISSDMEFNASFAVLLYVLNEIKSHDAYCGGDTHFVFLEKSDTVAIRLDQDIVNDIERAIRETVESAQKSRTLQMTNALEKVAKKWGKELGVE